MAYSQGNFFRCGLANARKVIGFCLCLICVFLAAGTLPYAILPSVQAQPGGADQLYASGPSSIGKSSSVNGKSKTEDVSGKVILHQQLGLLSGNEPANSPRGIKARKFRHELRVLTTKHRTALISFHMLAKSLFLRNKKLPNKYAIFGKKVWKKGLLNTVHSSEKRTKAKGKEQRAKMLRLEYDLCAYVHQNGAKNALDEIKKVLSYEVRYESPIISEEPNQEPIEQPNEEPNEQPNEEPNEEPDEEPNEEPNEEPDEEPYEEPNQSNNNRKEPNQVEATQAFGKLLAVYKLMLPTIVLRCEAFHKLVDYIDDMKMMYKAHYGYAKTYIVKDYFLWKDLNDAESLVDAREPVSKLISTFWEQDRDKALELFNVFWKVQEETRTVQLSMANAVLSYYPAAIELLSRSKEHEKVALKSLNEAPKIDEMY